MIELLAQSWFLVIPNYILAIFMWTLIGRFALSLFVPPDWENYIWRFFVRSTDWLVRLVGMITPRLVPPPLLVPIAAFWLFALRYGLFLILAPLAGPSGGAPG